MLIKNLTDEKSHQIKELIHRIANLETNLLIYGETGVGKDFWIDYLCGISKYDNILNLNCGDVPENLLESEWFGYKKGAFTGADKDYEGKWAQADKGILFLNQVDLLSLNLQAKLLRIIERKKYFPLGANKEVDINARFIFSADHDIEQKVRTGKFREDLYYRISSYSILVPPLRERKKDILSLFDYFAGGKGLRVALSRDAERILTTCYWQGNIREIENFITNLSIVKGGATSDKTVTDEDIASLIKTSQVFLETVKSR
ncbi:MAG: sigma-54-dependent Fis family transcriptional regulator [bacterium]|nr:sigma-54-dependent Fis family transcriptional regulator [bacterium]